MKDGIHPNYQPTTIRCACGACQTDGKSVPTEPGSASTIRFRQLSTGGLDAIAFYPAD